jgi:eukaryotic-like serine/threonine-protein kinase
MAGVQPHGLPVRYEDIELIARGGMADVYRATDSVLGRVVAVKMLADRYAADEDFRARFTREALTAASLSHPNVVTIFDVGEPDGTPFIVMEYLGGGSLADRLRDGRVSQDAAIAWLDQGAGALDAAHAAGIVHRDVKPGNLLLDDAGEVHVSDFGIARAAAHDPLTSAGTILGSSGYMAPEQARGEPATPASDRYALGCVAFELLTGRRPFEAESPTAEAALHASEVPPHASELDPSLPAAVDTVLQRALAKNPDARPRSAKALVSGLREALREDDAPTRFISPPGNDAPTRVQRSNRRPVALVAALLALAGAGTAAGLALSAAGDDPPRTVVVTETRPGTTQVRTVTVESTPAEEPPPPPPAEPSRSFSSAAAANDRAYQMMVNEDFEGALPILEDAYGELAGSGTTAEAYTAYNLAFTRFALGSCQDVLALLDRSESIQGERREISRLRDRADESCGADGERGKGNNKRKGKGND